MFYCTRLWNNISNNDVNETTKNKIIPLFVNKTTLTPSGLLTISILPMLACTITPSSIPNLPPSVFNLVPPLYSFQSVCRGLRWHRLFVCLSLLALVWHRDKGYCQCSHKKRHSGSWSSLFSHTPHAVVQTSSITHPHTSTWYEWKKNAHLHLSAQTHALSCSCCFVAKERSRFGTCEWIVNRRLWQYELVIVLDLNEHCFQCMLLVYIIYYTKVEFLGFVHITYS